MGILGKLLQYLFPDWGFSDIIMYQDFTLDQRLANFSPQAIRGALVTSSPLPISVWRPAKYGFHNF